MEEATAPAKRRFASLVNLVRHAGATFERFPLPILSAAGAAIAAHFFVGVDFEETDPLAAVIMTCVLGISLLFALRMLCDDRPWPRLASLAIQLAGLAALGIFYLTLSIPLHGADWYRFFMLMAATHLFASFAPYIGRGGELNGFWHYNKALLLRGALAALYSTVIFSGLSLAILACDTLLGFEVEGETYARLWFWVAYLYSAWFFLAGVPRDVRALDRTTEYPTGLRIFAQYALIPLIAIYLVILYAYLVKIVVEWELPNGWVTYPVMGVSIAGWLALLLAYPIRDQAENAWIKVYARFFSWLLYPLIGLVIIAIWTRIAEYGVTERRYLVALAIAWLLGITVYFTLKRDRDIRWIPISLCLVSLAAVFGPWSGTSVSKRSQLNRLREMLVVEEVMPEAGLSDARKAVAFETEQEISSIVKYLEIVHDLEPIRDWYAEPEQLPDELTAELAMGEMGLRYRGRRERASEVSLGIDAPQPLAVSGFDYVYLLDEWFRDDSVVAYRADLDSVTRLALDGTTVSIGHPEMEEGQIVLELEGRILELDAKQRRGETLTAADAMIEASSAGYFAVLYVTNAIGSLEADNLKLERLAATILVDLRQ
jgi:hypothetical protein